MFGWYAVGAGGRYPSGREIIAWLVAFGIVSLAWVGPIRVIMLHLRLGALLAALLPAVALLAGASSAGRLDEERWVGVAMTIGVIIFAAIVTHLLWRAWLYAMYGRAATAVWQWQRRPALSHDRVDAIAHHESWALGTEIPIDSLDVARCPACGVSHVAERQAPLPVSAARIGFESVVTRGRMFAMAVLAALAAVCAYLGGIRVMDDIMNAGMRLSEPRGWTAAIGGAMLFACGYGAMIRMIASRRRLVPGATMVVIVCFLFWILPTFLAILSHPTWATTLLVAQGCWMVMGVLGAVIAMPIVHAVASVLLGPATARELREWIAMKSAQ